MGFIQPQQAITALHVMPGQTIADFGCGIGEYVFIISEKLTDSGTIYALDIQKELLHSIASNADSLKINNIKTIWTDLEGHKGVPIESNTVDSILISNILFQIEDKGRMLSEAQRILKPGGRVLVIDWTESFNRMGPNGDVVVMQEAARKLFESHNFVFLQDIPAGSHHHATIFKKN